MKWGYLRNGEGATAVLPLSFRVRMKTMASVRGNGSVLVVALLLCVAEFFVAASAKPSCDYHPRDWCSTKEIARLCQVEQLCTATVWSSSKPVAPKVNLTLYYESRCHECRNLTTTQIWPTFQKLSDIMNLELVPYGNTIESWDPEDGQWVFDCQHGPDECTGDLIETCALALVNNITKSLPFINCVEKSDDIPADSAPGCAKEHGINYDRVMNCVNSRFGNYLQHLAGVKTESLQLIYPQQDHVPWVTLNGIHSDAIEDRSESDLLSLICDTYTGVKPDVCTKKNERC